MLAVAPGRVLFRTVRDGADPHGVEAHTGDVVEDVLDAFPGAAAVGAEVAGGSRVIGAGEAVGDNLVDRSVAPFLGFHSWG